MTDSLDMWADSTHSSPIRVSASIMRSSRTKAATAQRSVSIVMQSTGKQRKPRVLSRQLCEQMPEFTRGGKRHFQSDHGCFAMVGLLKSFLRIKMTNFHCAAMLMIMIHFLVFL